MFNPVLLFIFFLAHAENKGDLAKTRIFLPLFSEPSLASRVVGKLPAGTIVRYRGERIAQLASVEVELEIGWVTGWVTDSELDFGQPDAVAGFTNVPIRQKIPSDEAILLRREPTFLYGIYGGSNWGMMTPFDASTYSGLGFSVGGRIGWFLNLKTSLDLLVDYSMFNGKRLSTHNVSDSVSFGYCHVLAAVAYRINAIELSALGGVAFGLSVPDTLPSTITLESSNDLTSPAFGVGVSYRFETSNYARIVTGVQYRIHALSSPLLVHSVLASAGIFFEG